MIYRNYWTMMTSEDYDIMYRKGTSHRDVYKVQDTKDAGHMRNLATDGGFFPMSVVSNVLGEVQS